MEKEITYSKVAKPFLKWAGGKGQLLETIRLYYPSELGITIKKYCEPMVGAGAVLFDVLNNYDIEKVMINDINVELINVYTVVRDKVELLLIMLKSFEQEHLSKDEEKRKEYYYYQRKIFNDLKKKASIDNAVLRASLFIYLNKTCFNGLHRVNRNGEFNVPMGAYKNPKICDVDNLMSVSRKLQGVEIISGDYHKCENFIDENTFVYFDPPYRPLSKTSEFTAYNEFEFDDESQVELASFIEKIARKGCNILASNSDPKNTDVYDDFFDELYKSFEINRVNATRIINSKSEGRGIVSELLICNYKGEKMRNFTKWLSSFRESISSYNYYVDFVKVFRNVEEIKVELNILNSLIGSSKIEEDFINILKKYPDTRKAIPILLAKRELEIYCQDDNGGVLYNFNRESFYPNDECYFEKMCYFMRNTGLFELLENHIVSNLLDYVTGVETGLDSNGRKNRGGHLMEDLVETYIKKAGFVKNKTYFKEMYIHQIEQKWSIDLSAISNQGKMEKRFDFVVKTDGMIYGIETNFYTGGGSKLNETARSYKTLAKEVDTIDGFTFVWLTDGKGWNSAKNNLEETFDVMENIYNICDMENDVLKKVFK